MTGVDFRPKNLHAIEYYLKIFGTLCCIVPNITLSLSSQIKSYMKSESLLQRFLLPVFLIMAISFANAQSKQDSAVNQDLYKEIAHMDSVLFNVFNSHNVDKLKTLFTDDLEFYHDLGGLTNYPQNMEAFKNNFAKNNGLKRELVKGSLEVFPIKDYGAIEIGEHTFCHLENGKQDCGTFKFVHIWQKKNGEWKIARVISYGH
jgi:hypothetical protein